MSYITANCQSGPARESAGGDWRLPRCASRHPERSRSPADRQGSSSSLAAHIRSIVKEQHAPGQRERTRTLPPRRTSLVTNRLANFRGRVYWPFGQRRCYLYFSEASAYDAKGSLNVSRVPTQTLKLLQSSLRDYRLLSPCSRHCAALRAGLITIAAPRLNIAVEPSGRPQSCHTDFEAPSPLKCLLFPQATKSDRAQMCRTYGAGMAVAWFPNAPALG